MIPRSALALAAFLLGWTAQAQIIVPDRLPDGGRQPVLTTPAERGTLPFDTVRTLPEDHGGRDTWWHRHALFEDGRVQLALDPLVDLRTDLQYRPNVDGGETVLRGHRNLRGVRYAGRIDSTVRFGGTVLEMQRLLAGAEAEYVAASGRYPGMGPGKIRPTEDGLSQIDHSLAEVWFDARLAPRLRAQWGLGATGMGPGVRNLLWHAGRAPAPYLLLEVDLSSGWTYRWVQSRQRGLERLPAQGAREGRYAPLGLGLRSVTKTWAWNEQSVHLSLVTARWTDAQQRGIDRASAVDWAAALSPWSPPATDADRAWYIAGHDGLDLQWRRPRSTWYAQLRTDPTTLPRLVNALDLQKPRRQWMVGHVRHGERCTWWTEWAPTEGSMPDGLDPNLPVDLLGIQDASPWRASWIQGAEWRVAGWSFATEIGRMDDGTWRWTHRLEWPTATADPAENSARARRARFRPNRWGPGLVPLQLFVSNTRLYGTTQSYWSMGVANPLSDRRKSF